jgi:hypothetical protein
VVPQEIDRYLATLDEPKRSTLEALRESILEIFIARMRELGFEP